MFKVVSTYYPSGSTFLPLGYFFLPISSRKCKITLK
nr:MAG TPA: hypothetical protein [Caudoviricetes sp.]